MAVSALTQFDPSRFFQLPPNSGRSGLSVDAEVGVIAASHEFDGRVSVTTAEGDRITLSSSLTESFRSAAYRGSAQLADRAIGVQETTAEQTLSREFGVTVEGTLNEEEVQDLTALFKTIGNIFKTFFGGQGEEAFDQTVGLADGFGELTTLSGLDLDLHVQRSVAVATAGQSVIDSAAPSRPSDTLADTPGAAPSTLTAIPSASTGTTAPTQLTESGKQTESLAEQLLKAVEESRLRRHTLQKFLARLLERAERQAKAAAEADDEKAKVAEQAREKVLEAVGEREEPARYVVAAFSYSRTVVNQSQYTVQA